MQTKEEYNGISNSAVNTEGTTGIKDLRDLIEENQKIFYDLREVRSKNSKEKLVVTKRQDRESTKN